MKRFLSICALILALCTLCTLCVCAQNGDLVVDCADLLDTSEEEALRSTLASISALRGCDIVVVTVNSLDGKSAMAYADDFYDYGGYADDGILLLVAMDTREYHITTSGTCIDRVTNYALYTLEDAFVSYLSEGSYYAAFAAYAATCDYVLDPANADELSDTLGVPTAVVISLIVGFIIALIVTGVMRGKLKSVRTQPAADQYVRKGSMVMAQSYDRFLYRNVTRTARPKENSSSGGGVHRSSSGRSHGGRGGRF